MKNRICILLAVCMLLACIGPVIADANTVDLVTFNQLSDFDGWKRRTESLTNNHKSQDFVRVGNYSLKMVDFETEHTWTYNTNQSIDGMSYINMWLYCDNPNNVTIDFRPNIGGKDIITLWTIALDFNGWKLVSFPLSKYSGSITKISFSTYGYDFGARGGKTAYPDNTTAKLGAACVYLNHMWLSKDLPAGTSFGASSVKDGAEFVKHNLSKIAIEAPDISESSLNAGNVSIEPEVSFHTEVEDGYLNVVFDEELTFATDYTISVDDGFYDKDGMNYEGKTISFKTRGENDNIPPDVELISPESGGRFYPGDTVTLSARATDDDGSISYVEFYCDGVLIEGSRTYSDNDEFTFQWKNVKENLSGNTITAMARDNKGKEEFSDGVKIKIIGYHAPTVAIVSPSQVTTVPSNVSGIQQSISLEIKTSADDVDGEVKSVTFYLDGEPLVTETEKVSAASYTYTGDLTLGEHIFSVTAEDNDGLTTDASVAVNAVEYGKVFPELNIKSSNDDYKLRKYKKNLDGAHWQVDTKLVLNDNKMHVLNLGGTSNYSILTFADNGTVTADDKAVDVPKRADGVYDISLIVTQQTDGKTVCHCILNGETVLQNKEVTGFTNGASVSLSNADEALAYIDECAFYNLGDAASLSEVLLYDESGKTIDNFDEADIRTDSVYVDFEDGISKETVEGNVSFVDKVTREILPSIFKNGKTYLLSKLKSDYEYLLKIGSSISDSNGRGLCGDKYFDIRTKKNPVTVTYSTPMDSLSSDTTAAFIDVVLQNNTDEMQKSDIICAVYDGTEMKQYIVEPVTIPANTEKTRTLMFSFENEVTENTYVEVFAVESIDTLLPVSDTIFRLVYKN